jgi:hypothetical protein
VPCIIAGSRPISIRDLSNVERSKVDCEAELTEFAEMRASSSQKIGVDLSKRIEMRYKTGTWNCREQ